MAAGLLSPAAAPTAGESAAARSGVLASPVGTESWQQELTAQLALMSEQGDGASAVMKLAPSELGELEIRLTLRDGEAAVAFAAPAAEARQALEVAQPRLQEMLAAQGIGLGKVSIFSGFQGNPNPDARRPGGLRPADRQDGEVPVETVALRARRAELGVVDTYA